jgi:hypothetical protein
MYVKPPVWLQKASLGIIIQKLYASTSGSGNETISFIDYDHFTWHSVEQLQCADSNCHGYFSRHRINQRADGHRLPPG